MKKISAPYITELGPLEAPDAIIRVLKEKGSRGLIDSVNWPDAADYCPDASFCIAHNGERIFILFENNGLGMRAVNSANQSPVSQDSCVEFFVMPDSGTKRYWNFEFNAIGAVNASHRVSRPEPTRLSDFEIEQIKRVSSVGTKTFDEIDGEQSWSLLVSIPFKLIGLKFNGEDIPAKANFLKCGSKTRHPHFLSWAPIKSETPNFHLVDYFGDLLIKGSKG